MVISDEEFSFVIVKSSYYSGLMYNEKTCTFKNFITNQATRMDNGILKDLNQELESPKDYFYNVEDGQFSFNFSHEFLLGKEGEVVSVTEPFADVNEIYILYIEDHYVECIGNVERTFPKNMKEHIDQKLYAIARHES